jgi:hypothetical protein
LKVNPEEVRVKSSDVKALDPALARRLALRRGLEALPPRA